MHPSQAHTEEVIRQAHVRAGKIQDLEKMLEDQRYLRGADARWMVRNTTCTRTAIAALLGISRVTLDKYLADGGMDDAYLAEVRRVQKEQGVELYSCDNLPIAGIPWEKPAVPAGGHDVNS